MKRFLYLIIAVFLVQSCVFAVDWVNLVSPNGRVVALDKDSIIEDGGYYFYNIKFVNHNSLNPIIVTMQSGVKHPFSARIKTYTEQEYASLNGDYTNITLNKTSKLEPVTYDSLVNTCHKAVRDIKHPVVSNLVILN